MSADVSRDAIDAEVTRALPAYGAVTGVRPLLKGYGHQSFVLETRSGTTILLKIAWRAEQLRPMKALREVLQLAAEHAIPTPKLLHFSEGTASFDGRPWLVQEFLAGQDGEEAFAAMPDVQRAAFFHDFGAAVARLHAVHAGYFSGDQASSPRELTWAAAVEARLARVIHSHRQTGLLPRSTLERADDVIRSRARAISPAVRPSLVHRDLYLPNTLVADGRFRCLLDFEHARFADALYDFPKLTMWVFERFPDADAAFHAGYGANPLSTAEGRTRYLVTFGLELLAGSLYFKNTGQDVMLSDYRRRVDPWLAERM